MDNNKCTHDTTRTIEINVVPDVGAGKRVRRAFLTIIRGGRGDLGKHIVMKGPVNLGRDQGCDLSFSDPGVSRQHARIIFYLKPPLPVEDPDRFYRSGEK
jgi:hypothetical protein